jgi:hypothetical protein
MNKQEYNRAYWQKPAVKEKKKLEQRVVYSTEKGQEYEYSRRRTAKSRWMRSKCNARTRKKEWTIPLEAYENIISNPCKYCNSSIAKETGSGLDRIDNEKGYILGNVNPCCSSCNRRRSKSMSAQEFEIQTDLNKYKVK